MNEIFERILHKDFKSHDKCIECAQIHECGRACYEVYRYLENLSLIIGSLSLY